MRWTQEAAVGALRAFAEEHGRQPTFNEWQAARRQPHVRTIQSLFGSWRNGLAAAGMVPRGRGDYAHRRVAPRPCEWCGATLPPRNRRFCGRRCASRAQWSPQRRGRRTVRDSRGRGRLAYRVVAEWCLDRPLASDEVVHHIDGDKTNDRPSNLAVMSPGDHTRLHIHGGRVTALDGKVWDCVAIGCRKLVVSVAGSGYASPRVRT